MSVQNQKEIHGDAAGSAVPVRKGMDVLKLDVVIDRGAKQLLPGNIVQLVKQLPHLRGNILRRSTDLVFPRHIITALVFSRAFSQLITPGIVGVLRESVMFCRVSGEKTAL